MEINKRNIYIWLNHFRTFRTKDPYRLIEKYGGVEGVFENIKTDLEELIENKMIKTETAEEIRSLNVEKWYEELMKDLDKTGISVVTPADEDYPERLRYLSDYPLAIYYRGDISIANAEYSIGIIGSRRPTYYGMSVAEEFASELARKGFVIISGMAMGVDSRAHIGACHTGGRTIAVLGGGVDICYPRTNYDIYMEMCEGHLVLSEYEPGEAHLSNHFPLRNRIISGLSDGLLVVEAALRSGTLITTDYALEQGKDIYAIPGRVGDMMSKGVNNLIKNGAMMVDSPADIIMDKLQRDFLVIKQDNLEKKSGGIESEQKKINLNYLLEESDSGEDTKKNNKNKTKNNTKPKDERKKKIAKLPASQQAILGMLGYEPVFIDDIIRANEMNIAGTLHDIRKLEEIGLIRSIEQSYYILA